MTGRRRAGLLGGGVVRVWIIIGWGLAAVVAGAAGGGCAGGGASGPREARGAAHVILFVPGASGDGPWYGGVRRGLREAMPGARVETLAWGAPLPLFGLNFSHRGIHEGAEKKLAERIARVRERSGAAEIDIVAHSAGCGVALGGLARLQGDVAGPREVVLLAPSVSPGYDLSGATARIEGSLHVFHSERDTLFLSWRTSRFGTYDRVKTKAAGNVGFDLSRLAPDLRKRVRQHPYDPAWRALGNDGSHDGPVARAFTERVVAPLLTAAPPPPPPRSSAGSRD